MSVAGYSIADGNNGNDYAVSTVDDVTGRIDAASLSGTVTAANKTYDGTTNATITGRALSGVVPAITSATSAEPLRSLTKMLGPARQ